MKRFILILCIILLACVQQRNIVPASFVLDDADRYDIERAAAKWSEILSEPIHISTERFEADDYTLVLAPIPDEMKANAYVDGKTKTITVDPNRTDRNHFYPYILHEMGHTVGFMDLYEGQAVMNHYSPATEFSDADRAQCHQFAIRRCKPEFR